MFPCDLYAHGQSHSKTYGSSYVLMAHMETMEMFARVLNHIHLDIVARGDVAVRLVQTQRIVTTWSLFRSPIKPEWEDPANANGVTLTCRNPNDVELAWRQLLYQWSIGGVCHTVNGMQLSRRHHKSGLLFRVDVWLDPGAVVQHITDWLATVTDLSFVVCPRR